MILYKFIRSVYFNFTDELRSLLVIMTYNDTLPNGNYLGLLSSDFVKVADTLKESSYQIRRAGFACPIFLMCKESSSIGKILIPKEEDENKWNYYASFLDEFIQAGLIDKEKQPFFKKVYKNPDEFCCLFVAEVDFMQFVYIPYPID